MTPRGHLTALDVMSGMAHGKSSDRFAGVAGGRRLRRPSPSSCTGRGGSSRRSSPRFAVVGTIDLVQTSHTILRAYPIIGHARFLAELIRPEIRQYFIESNTEAAPYDRDTRDMVYERSKGLKGEAVRHRTRRQRLGYEFLRHSLRAHPATDLTPRCPGRTGLPAALRHRLC